MSEAVQSCAPQLRCIFLCAVLATGCALPKWLTPPDSRYDASAARDEYRGALRAQAEPLRADQTSAQKLREGEGLERRGERQRAMLAYFEAASLAPQDLEPRLRLAFLQIQGSPAKAGRSLQALVEERPGDSSAWLGLGLARLAEGELDRAQEAVERALDIGPSSAGLYSTLGAVEERLGKPQLARATLRQGLELYPDEPMLLNNLAVSYLIADDPAAAEPLLRRAATLKPGDGAIHNNLGLVSGLQGHFGEALEQFRRAGDEQAALNNLGYVYFLLGRDEQAIEAYERALLIGGSHTLDVLANLRRALERDP